MKPQHHQHQGAQAFLAQPSPGSCSRYTHHPLESASARPTSPAQHGGSGPPPRHVAQIGVNRHPRQNLCQRNHFDVGRSTRCARWRPSRRFAPSGAPSASTSTGITSDDIGQTAAVEQPTATRAESAVSVDVLLAGRPQVAAVVVRPELVLEHVFGVGRLPQHEVAGPLFPEVRMNRSTSGMSGGAVGARSFVRPPARVDP